MAIEQIKYADVICQHKTDGTIIPIKVRIKDEDGEYQTYVVKAYKDNTRYGEYLMPNGKSSTNHIWSFDCKIKVFDAEKRIKLFYNAFDNRWNLIGG